MIAGHLARAFELMEQYTDHPMDLADASLLVVSETLNTRKVFTVDRPRFLDIPSPTGASPLPTGDCRVNGSAC